MEHVCERCGENYYTAHRLARHKTRKTPCGVIMQPAEIMENQCKQCGRKYANKGNLNKHIRLSCKQPEVNVRVEDQLAEMRAQINKLEKELSQAPKQMLENAVSGQVNGPITQVTNNVNTVNNNISVNIRPWGAALELTDGEVEAALATVPGLAGTPTLAEVVSTLMELVKRAHTPAAARNIHLNPKRADQALALTAGGWAMMPLAEATGVLFDAASARMEAPAGRKAAATPRQERERGLRAEVPVQYRIGKESAVQLGLRPMEAHLANTRPGGPGPLLLETAAKEVAPGGPLAAPGGPLAAARGQADGKQSERIREAIRATPVETRASGALEVGWILEVSKAANVSGKELFEELARGGEELAAAREAARIFTEEKMRPRGAPGAGA